MDFVTRLDSGATKAHLKQELLEASAAGEASPAGEAAMPSEALVLARA